MVDKQDLTTLNRPDPLCKRCGENPSTHRIRSEQVCQYGTPHACSVRADCIQEMLLSVYYYEGC